MKKTCIYERFSSRDFAFNLMGNISSSALLPLRDFSRFYHQEWLALRAVMG